MLKRPQGQKRAAVMVTKIATGEIEEQLTEHFNKNPSAVAIGRLGGKRAKPAHRN